MSLDVRVMRHRHHHLTVVLFSGNREELLINQFYNRIYRGAEVALRRKRGLWRAGIR